MSDDTGLAVRARLNARRDAGTLYGWTATGGAGPLVTLRALVCDRTYGRSVVTVASTSLEAALHVLDWRLDELAGVATWEGTRT